MRVRWEVALKHPSSSPAARSPQPDLARLCPFLDTSLLALTTERFLGTGMGFDGPAQDERASAHARAEGRTCLCLALTAHWASSSLCASTGPCTRYCHNA